LVNGSTADTLEPGLDRASDQTWDTAALSAFADRMA
jgi:hypothetical protein